MPRKLVLLTGVTVVLGLAGSFVLSTGTGAHASCNPGSVNTSTVQTLTENISGYSGSQLDNAALIMNAATALNLDTQAQTLGVMAAMRQSSLQNLDHSTGPDPSAIGIFQEGDTWGTGAERSDPTTAATLFFTRLQLVPDWKTATPGTDASAVFPGTAAAEYTPFFAAAAAVVNGLDTLAGPGACGTHQAGDDYPWATAATPGTSPLGYGYRQCTDFVAWRLNRDAGITEAPWLYTGQTLTPGGGNAIQWKAAWVAHGWPTSQTPIPGSIAWWGTSAGRDGHVAYVQSVNGNSITVEEYNWGGSLAYDLRTVSVGAPDLYLSVAPRS